MRLRTILRIMPGAWLTPLMLALVWLYVSQTITLWSREPYTVGLTARAMNVLGLVVPVFAGAAAWEGGRWAGAGLWGLPFVRRRLVVAVWSIAPTFVGGAIVIVAAATQVLLHEGLVLPDLPILSLALTLLAAHVLVGFVLGTAWPRVLAVPLVAVVSLATFVLPRVLEPRWLIHLFGTSLELCCRPDEILSPPVAAAIVLMSGGVLFAAALWIMDRPATWLVRAGAAGTVAVAFAVAAVIAMPIPMSPTTARQGEAVACMDGAHVRLCAWPEHAAQLPADLDAVDRAVSAWSVLGLETPRIITEAPLSELPGARTMALWVDQGPYELVRDLARAMLPTRPACGAFQPWPAEAASPYLEVWLAAVAGVPRTAFRFYDDDHDTPDPDEFPDARPETIVPVRPLVDDILALPVEAQSRWANENLAAMRRCSVEAPMLRQ